MKVYIDPSAGTFGFTNDGFRGMGIRKDEQYNFSVSARLSENSDIKMTVELITSGRKRILAKQNFRDFQEHGKTTRTSFKASATEA